MPKGVGSLRKTLKGERVSVISDAVVGATGTQPMRIPTGFRSVSIVAASPFQRPCGKTTPATMTGTESEKMKKPHMSVRGVRSASPVGVVWDGVREDGARPLTRHLIARLSNSQSWA